MMRACIRHGSIIVSVIIIAVTSAVSGCSLHKSNITEPLIELPGTYSGEENKPAPQIGRWWERFDDETLDSLMQEAFGHNLDIAQAYERLEQSHALVRITDSSRGPVLNIEGAGGRARQSTAAGAITQDTYRLSAAASFELDLWGKLKAKSEATRFDALASQYDLKALYISISAQLADLYYRAVEQRAQLALTDQTIASFQDTLDRVERRYREGLVPAIDLYQSRQNLASAKAQRPVFAQNLATTVNALSVLTGQFPDREAGGSVQELPNAPKFPAGIPSELLTNRPDIESAYLRLRGSDERIGAAIADRFPSFNLVGTYGGASDKVRTILDSPNIFWNILLQAAQPVIDSGRRKAEVDRTESVFRENLAVYHKTVLNAFKDIEDSLAKGKASEERIVMLKQTVAASDSALRLALARYMQGLTDYLPVLTEQLRNVTAKSNLLASRRQFITDRIQLARALGGHWADGMIHENLTSER